MPYPHKNFKGQLEDEVVLCFYRRHWIQVLPSLIFLPLCLLLFCAALVFYPMAIDNRLLSTLITFGVILLTAFVHFQFLAIFRYYLSTVIVTNMHIVMIDKSVFLRDTRTALDLRKLQDIKKKQNGVLQNILKFGTLHIEVSAGDPFVLRLVPQPDFYFKQMNAAKQAANEGSADNADVSPPPVLTTAHIDPASTTVSFLETSVIK